MILMRLLREIVKNDYYSIRKASKNFNIPEEMITDIQLTLENFGYIEKLKEEAGCGCTLVSCSCCTSFNKNFNFINLTQQGINALKRS